MNSRAGTRRACISCGTQPISWPAHRPSHRSNLERTTSRHGGANSPWFLPPWKQPTASAFASGEREATLTARCASVRSMPSSREAALMPPSGRPPEGFWASCPITSPVNSTHSAICSDLSRAVSSARWCHCGRRYGCRSRLSGELPQMRSKGPGATLRRSCDRPRTAWRSRDPTTPPTPHLPTSRAPRGACPRSSGGFSRCYPVCYPGGQNSPT